MELNNVKSGQEIYFIDKSEGPGVVIYIHGTAVDVGSTDATLEITDSGTLIAPGYLAPYEPEYKVGSLIKLSPEDGEFLSATEFSKLKEQYQLVPSGEEDEEVPLQQEEKEDTDVLEPTPEEEREVTPEEIEEGTPEYELEGLYLSASLKSWATSVGVTWPKGFPQDWMSQVYDDLPEGEAEKTPSGEPIVGVPGTKGPGVPPDFKESVEIEKEYDDASKKVQEARDQLDAAEKDEDLTAIDKGEAAVKDAVKKFLAVKERAQKLWKRPPEEVIYEQVPGSRAPYSLSHGRAGLRQELKQLFDNYQKTLSLIDNVEESEKRVDNSQKELDLLLSLRRKQLVDKSHGKGIPHYVLEPTKASPYPTHRVPVLLKKLKYNELKAKPYLWTREDRDKMVDQSEAAAIFADRVGGQLSFFDLPSEEIDQYVKKEVEKNGPMAPEEVARRAWKYANEYKNLISERMGWKDMGTEIQKYFRFKHSLVISKERADRIEDEIYKKETKSIDAKGRDVESGVIREVVVPVQELFDNVVHKILKDYEKRVQWLQFLQTGRKAALAKQKGDLRRMLVEEKEEKGKKEVLPIDDEKYKDAIVEIFRKYAKFSHEKGTTEKIPSRFRIHHGLPAYEEKSKELAGKKAEEAQIEGQIKSLENELRTVYAPYKKADEDLMLFQEDVGRISDPNIAQEDVQNALETSKQISDKIKQMISQREFIHRFYKNREGWQEKVKNISENIQKSINTLEEQRSAIFKSEFPKRIQGKIFDYDRKLKMALHEYQSAAHDVEEKMDVLYSKLEKIRGEKSKITDEIGV